MTKKKSYEHDFDKTGICKKCHEHKSKVKMVLCPVMGKEEVANFREVIES